jgi:hypothetical protein
MVRTAFAIVTAAILWSTPIPSAHESFRIIGTIVKFEKWRLEIKTVYGEPYSVLLQPSPPIERNKKPATESDSDRGRSCLPVRGFDPRYVHLAIAVRRRSAGHRFGHRIGGSSP